MVNPTMTENVAIVQARSACLSMCRSRNASTSERRELNWVIEVSSSYLRETVLPSGLSVNLHGGHCRCRKPKVELLLRHARNHELHFYGVTECVFLLGALTNYAVALLVIYKVIVA